VFISVQYYGTHSKQISSQLHSELLQYLANILLILSEIFQRSYRWSTK